jgi:hypothetical protein
MARQASRETALNILVMSRRRRARRGIGWEGDGSIKRSMSASTL